MLLVYFQINHVAGGGATVIANFTIVISFVFGSSLSNKQLRQFSTGYHSFRAIPLITISIFGFDKQSNAFANYYIGIGKINQESWQWINAKLKAAAD